MSDSVASIMPPQSRGAVIASWVLRIIIGLLFLFAAAAKLSGQPMMVAEFATVGLGQWFRYFTATLEVVGAILVLWPRTTGLGALLLLVVDTGAFIAQVSILHIDWVHTVVIGLLLLTLVWLQRSTIPGFLRGA